jgi:hypothetical protein
MTEREESGAGASERGVYEQRAVDPAGRPEPYVDGPTGPAPLATESRGDPGAEDDRRTEGGAAGGALAGTAVAGPVGGVVGGVVGATIGAAADEGRDHSTDDPTGEVSGGEASTDDPDRWSGGTVSNADR